jgi:hypothetical protein
MMPAQQTTPATLSPADLEAENPWNGEQLSPEAREKYFGKPKPRPQPDEEYEDEDFGADEEGYAAGDDENAEFESASESGEEEPEQEGASADHCPNGGETDWSTEDIVRAINDIARRTVETGKLKIGQLLFEKVFKGDIKEVLSKNPNKCTSLRAICEDKDLMVDHRKLGSWVKAAAFKTDLQLKEVDVSKFYLSHFLAILKVGNAEKRLELAKRAAAERLSGRDIVTSIEAATPKNPPPTKGTTLLKKVDDPFSLFDDQKDKEFLSDKARLVTELDSEERLRIIKAIGARLGKIREVNEFLETSKRTLVTIEMENLNGESQ